MFGVARKNYQNPLSNPVFSWIGNEAEGQVGEF
jgi:hypothetical protein